MIQYCKGNTKFTRKFNRHALHNLVTVVLQFSLRIYPIFLIISMDNSEYKRI